MYILLLSLINQLRDIDVQNEIHRRDNPGRGVQEIRIDYMNAVFFHGKKRIGELGIIHALDSLATDTHVFETFDLHDATSVSVISL